MAVSINKPIIKIKLLWIISNIKLYGEYGYIFMQPYKQNDESEEWHKNSAWKEEWTN